MAKGKPIPRGVWLVQLPIILLFAFLLLVVHWGEAGTLHSPALQATYGKLQSIAGWGTDLKFRMRGPRPLGAKIVMVEIDEDAISQAGRWPWHRDLLAVLIESAFEAGARAVGLDIVFSEADQRVPDGVAELLQKHGLADTIPTFETDLMLQRIIALNRDHLVLGWMTDDNCFPALEPCDQQMALPKGFEKFAYGKVNGTVDPARTAMVVVPTLTANIDGFNEAAAHSGYFLGWPDADAVTRRTFVAALAKGRVFPSLSLEMARVGLDDELALDFDRNGQVASVRLQRSGKSLPVSGRGAMAINFLGSGYHQGPFAWVPAMELIGDEEKIKYRRADQVHQDPRKDLFKDAYVFIGLSAQGANDLRNFPLATGVPGMEGHATVLENILTGQFMRTGVGILDWRMVLLFMTLGALIFGLAVQRLEALPAMLLFAAVFVALGLLDVTLLFARHRINLPTVFMFGELVVLFLGTLAVKYVLEERSKKFIRGAFSKYLAPSVVNTMLDNPSKLKVGGEKKELTILFSDIRSFSTFSEKMDAPVLAKFLNEYLGAMTEMVCEEGGTLDKYIGDAVMAFWGAPVDNPAHAARCCRAAQRMMQKLAEQRPHFQEVYGIRVDVGVGINSGAVNVGNMGSERIFEYTVIGDNVNLASRLEGLTKYYRSSIVTTRFTIDAIERAGQPLPELRVLDEVKVKGKKKAVEILQVIEQPMAKEGLEAFEKARQLYRKKQWDEAIAGFKEASKLLGGDGPSEMYLERIEELRMQPNDDWDGTWEMHTK